MYSADDLTAEAALVGASRAADASVLYLLAAPEPAPEEHGQPEPVEAEVALAAGWSRREAKVMALDELAARRRIAGLADGTVRVRPSPTPSWPRPWRAFPSWPRRSLWLGPEPRRLPPSSGSGRCRISTP